MKKKSHPEFVRALKARNLKITVVGTYENCLSRVAVRCDVCGWEWAPVGGSLRHTKCMVIINNLTVWFKPTVSNDYLSVCMIAACAIPI